MVTKQEYYKLNDIENIKKFYRLINYDINSKEFKEKSDIKKYF
ncbi:hypothetical protein CFB3_25590 [Clostridium folliculivorans]|nr:hypothetical protein CFB3_25590 [Clostridium folliculivorans]